MVGKLFREQKLLKKLERNLKDSKGNKFTFLLYVLQLLLISFFRFRERLERRLQQRTNPRGNVVVNINATDLFTTYDDEFDYM